MHKPAEIFPVSDYIFDELGVRGWSLEFLREKMQCRMDALVGIMLDEDPITPEMAMALGNAFGTGPEVWFNLAHLYDDYCI